MTTNIIWEHITNLTLQSIHTYSSRPQDIKKVCIRFGMDKKQFCSSITSYNEISPTLSCKIYQRGTIMTAMQE